MTDGSMLHKVGGNGPIIEINDGNDIDAKSCDGYTVLMLAAMHSKYDIVDIFLKKGANVNCRDDSDRTPLHWAAERGDIRMVLLLAGNGADLDARATNGVSPLLLASFKSHQDVVQLLINQGANIYCCDNCVNVYCCNSYSENFGLFEKWSFIHFAARYGWVETIHFIVAKGINLNIKGGYDETPLMVAIGFYQKEVVELVLNCNVELNSLDKFRCTALFQAIKGSSLGRYSLDLVKLLLSKGADLEIKGWDDQTPLMFATSLNRKEAVELCINAGADIHCLDEDKWTLLHFAAENGWIDFAGFLLERGLDINAMTYHTNENTSVSTSSPLHVACIFYKLKMVAYLLESGADPFLENRERNLPYSELVTDEDFPMENDGDDGPLTADQKPLIIVKIIKLFIEYGGYIRPAEYEKILEKDVLKAGLLQDESVCSQIIINKFNNKDLLDVYKVPTFAQNLTDVEYMKIKNKSARAREIESSVRQEIQTKGYCDVLEPHPIVLGLLAIKPLVNYYEQFVKVEVPPEEVCICDGGCKDLE